MIINDTIPAIESSREGEFYYPRYDDFCLSNVPNALANLILNKKTEHPLEKIIRGALPQKKYDKVVVLLIDGFGLDQLEKYYPTHSFLKTLVNHGTVIPITTVYPSTTAAALTSVHSGLTPQEHGLLEWWVYFEEIDETIVSLPFKRKNDEHPDTLVKEGIDPRILFDGETIYTKLKKLGVPSYKFIKKEMAYSAYSSLIHDGALIVPHNNLDELANNICNKLESVPGPAYFFVYYDCLDSSAHMNGPDSKPYLEILKNFSTTFQESFLNKLSNKAKENTVLFVTADHGHIHQPKEKFLDLVDYPEITNLLAKNKKGLPILPWGSPRDLYFKVQPGKREELMEKLSSILNGRAIVTLPETLMANGLYGRGTPHKNWRKRLGDAVVLCKDEFTMWYEPRAKLGGHGGMTKDEMLIPLAVLPLDHDM